MFFLSFCSELRFWLNYFTILYSYRYWLRKLVYKYINDVMQQVMLFLNKSLFIFYKVYYYYIIIYIKKSVYLRLGIIW